MTRPSLLSILLRGNLRGNLGTPYLFLLVLRLSAGRFFAYDSAEFTLDSFKE